MVYVAIVYGLYGENITNYPYYPQYTGNTQSGTSMPQWWDALTRNPNTRTHDSSKLGGQKTSAAMTREISRVVSDCDHERVPSSGFHATRIPNLKSYLNAEALASFGQPLAHHILEEVCMWPKYTQPSPPNAMISPWRAYEYFFSVLR